MHTDEGAARAADMLLQTGLVAVSGALPAGCCPAARAAVARRVELVDAALRSRGLSVGSEGFKFREVSARGLHRFDLLFDLEEGESTGGSARPCPRPRVPKAKSADE